MRVTTITFTIVLIFAFGAGFGQNVGIGTNAPHASAKLEIKDTEKGFLMPRMTTAQRDAIAFPATGLQIVNLDDLCIDMYDGTNWIKTCGQKNAGTYTNPIGAWVKKASLNFGKRMYAVAFSIDNIGYFATGLDAGNTAHNDFWAYDPGTNVWSQKADVSSQPRFRAVGFSIDNKGYIGTGQPDFSSYLNDFWQYDPGINTWVQKADFAGGGRSQAFGFGDDSHRKGYIGTGFNDISSGWSDLWVYEEALNSWRQIAGFPGGGRTAAAAVINQVSMKVMIATGYNPYSPGSGPQSDCWIYDITSAVWTRVADLPGSPRDLAVATMHNSTFLVGGGEKDFIGQSDFYEYQMADNKWVAKANYGGGPNFAASSFSVNNQAYVVGGYGSATTDLWTLTSAAGVAYNSNPTPNISNTYSDGKWVLENGNIHNENNANVGIGVAAPSTPLEVNGKIKTASLQITSGAAQGKLLISDASGNATWGNDSSTFRNWSINGNANTNPINNFLGTTDANDLVIKTNNQEGIRVKSISPVQAGIVAPTNLLLLTVPGTVSNKWPLSAAFQLGSYTGSINATTQMDIALGNGATGTPDTKVMRLFGNGNVEVTGEGKFGNYLRIGSDVAEGYYQNSQDGAYRALATGGTQGYFFQNYNGANTSMYVGLNGAYAGNVGIGNVTPSEKLTVSGNGLIIGDLQLAGSAKVISPKFKVTQVWYTVAGLPPTGNFTSGGGTILLNFSGMGFRATIGPIAVSIVIDGVFVGTARGFASAGSFQSTLSTDFLVLKNISAGDHTVYIEAISPTLIDTNSFFNLSVLELPF